jgi:hypothetical protein
MMTINNPHLIDWKDEENRLQGSHPNRVYLIGRSCCSDSVKHDVQINMEDQPRQVAWSLVGDAQYLRERPPSVAGEHLVNFALSFK